MKIRFTKMQGLGNDYIYVNGFRESVPEEMKKDLAVKCSDRHFGIGSDGLIFINPSDIADFEMEMYNADGSRSEMCGNGIRCVAKYVFDHEMTSERTFTIESMGRIKKIEIIEGLEKASRIRVDMGAPILKAEEIPVRSLKETVIDEEITAGEKVYHMTCVSMGNPHAVIFEDPDRIDLANVGPLIECHDAFPNRTNVEFVRVIDRNHVRMRVWERGTGETFACGTGCCATAVACILNGFTDREVVVSVLGGELNIVWADDDHVYMTGPAVTVFDGEVEI